MLKVLLSYLMRWIASAFLEIKGLFCGKDGKLSVRRIMASAVLWHMLVITSRVITECIDKDCLDKLGSYSTILMIEASLVAALLTLTTWQNNTSIKSDEKNSTESYE